MPEYHAGTDVEIADGVPSSGFRNAIPNTKRYMKKNKWTVDDVATAAYQGDLGLLETLLSTGDELNLFNGDLNAHVEAEQGATKSNYTALHLASAAGQTECIELLLKAGADPHVRESMPYGQDPEDGLTSLDLAKKCGWDDCVELLEQAEKNTPYGYYQAFGKGNNSKSYECWEFGKKPAKGWYMMRPGAAQQQGLDPKKYGGELAEPEDEGDDAITAALSAAPAQKPLPIGLLFPGQGSQYVKMMTNVKDIPKVKEYLAKAESILGRDILKLCLEGPETALEETQNCQPAMFVAGMAGVEKLRAEREEAVTRAKVVAGLSLGEYTALCVAGVFSFEDGLKLVKLRGEAMQEAAQEGKQLMLSVAGLEKDKLAPLCVEAARKEGAGAVCSIANCLFPGGFSVGGTEKAINELKTMAEKAGALQAKVLKTAGAFHTSLMAPAQEKLGKALDEMLPKMSPPRHQVYMNATAQAIKPGANPKEVVELLKRQLTNPVLWEPSVRAMIKAGCTEFYEVGPMKQIKAMMKRIDSKVWGTTTNIEI
uniref:Malonyl-CoA:ACP transacylase (MAT) domain-containing protein n=1 Tax=Alexandrium catenella TaxID=2925 RepID=A0A7S1MAS5_ALECA